MPTVMLADVQRATDVFVVGVVDLSVAERLAPGGPVIVAEQLDAGCGADSDHSERAEFAEAEARQLQASALVLIAMTAYCPPCRIDDTHAALADVAGAVGTDEVVIDAVGVAAHDCNVVAVAVVDAPLASVTQQTSIYMTTRQDEQHIAALASRAAVVVALDSRDSTWMAAALVSSHIIVCRVHRFAESASRPENCSGAFGSWISMDTIGG